MVDTAWWKVFGSENCFAGERGTCGKRDCHRAPSRNLNIFTNEAFTKLQPFYAFRPMQVTFPTKNHQMGIGGALFILSVLVTLR